MGEYHVIHGFKLFDKERSVLRGFPHCWSWCSLVLGLALGETSWGRFVHTDADEIDDERKLTVEHYNDVVSYEFPLRWDRDWEDHRLGYRVSAGSLTVSRFLFREEIKLGTSTDSGRVGLDFTQIRDEGMLEQRLEQELRLALIPVEGVRLSLMGDGGSFKKWGDVGAALGLWQDSKHFAEVFYWSVDHYYNTKESLPRDRYERETKSYGVEFNWHFATELTVAGKFETDTPLEWQRTSAGYTYTYARRTSHATVTAPVHPLWLLQGGYTGERKQEGKTWNVTHFSDPDPGQTYRKSLERKVDIYSLDLLSAATVEREMKLGVKNVRRNGDYTFAQGDKVPAYSIAEEASSDSRRREWVVSGTVNTPCGEGKRFQWGFFYNRVNLSEREVFDHGELKAQAAWELKITRNASALINTTWDIDQLVDDKGERFRPWGGGDLQFLMVF